MSWVDKAVARENEIFRIIGLFKQLGLEFVVVGGYAVSALTRHRFSVDCDIVIPRSLARRFGTILLKSAYILKVRKTDFDEAYGGLFMSFKRKVEDFPVTVDLLAGSLVCRATSASWSYSYIAKNSVNGTMIGAEESITARVPEKELLVAFKIHSGREADLRDVIMLSQGLDLKKVRRHIKKGKVMKLQEQVKKELDMLEDPKLVSSLKAVYSLREDVSGDITRTKRRLESLLTER